MKKILILFYIFCFISCSKKGDKLIGVWVNKYDSITITKAGEYYFISRFISNFTNNDYCIFENSCFKLNSNHNAILACDDNNNQLAYQGRIFTKK
jgi:hypothetical protein